MRTTYFGNIGVLIDDESASIVNLKTDGFVYLRLEEPPSIPDGLAPVRIVASRRYTSSCANEMLEYSLADGSYFISVDGAWFTREKPQYREEEGSTVMTVDGENYRLVVIEDGHEVPVGEGMWGWFVFRGEIVYLVSGNSPTVVGYLNAKKRYGAIPTAANAAAVQMAVDALGGQTFSDSFFEYIASMGGMLVAKQCPRPAAGGQEVGMGLKTVEQHSTVGVLGASLTRAATASAALAATDAVVELGAMMIERAAAALPPAPPARRGWWPWARAQAAPVALRAADILRTEVGRRAAGLVGAAAVHAAYAHGPLRGRAGADLVLGAAEGAIEANLLLILREVLPDAGQLVQQLAAAGDALAATGRVAALLSGADQAPVEAETVPAADRVRR